VCALFADGVHRGCIFPPSFSPTVTNPPSPLPTVSPIPTPSPSPPPSVSFLPSLAPTPQPTPAPSPQPSGDTRAALQLSIGLSGLSCDNYGTAEEMVMNKALTQVISGVSTANFGAHTCSGSTEGRRALQSTDSTITFVMSVDEAQVIVSCTPCFFLSVCAHPLFLPFFRSLFDA